MKNMKAQKHRSSLKPILITVLVLAVLGAAAWGGWTWYDNNVDRSGWVQEENTVYYKDFHGKYVSGWQTIGESVYYFQDDNAMALSWQVIGGKAYYFGDNGPMRTGWQTIEEALYYFGSDGVLLTGWQEIDGETYYFDGSGAAVSGWLDFDGQRYYLDCGIPARGWLEQEGGRYCFAEDGAMYVGWQTLEEQTYYFREDGIVAVGHTELEDGCYYFGEDGAMHTGWLDAPIGKTYFREDGTQAFGWTEIDGSRYYFSEDGAMYVGWLQEGEYHYYLQEDGTAAVGPKQIDGNTHYFTPKGIHVVLVNRSNYVPSYYKVNLVTVTGWHQVDALCLEPLQQMLADCNAAGIEYTFNSAYRTYAMQREILDVRTQEHQDNYGMSYEEARAVALRTVAYPGTSEHQLGLAVDILGEEAKAWLGEHCWEYGFILRYTAEKQAITGFVEELWHFRYVGKEVSMDMKDSGLCLEEYLGAA